MLASRQVETPYYRGVGRQKGMGFEALAQVIGRTAFPFLREYITPAAKGIVADMLEFAAPEIGEIKSFESAAKSVGKQTLEKRLGEGSCRLTGGKKTEENLLNNPVGREETFLQTFLIHHVKRQFSVPTFVAVSGNLGGKVPVVDNVLSSHEQENYPTTSLDENWIEFEFQKYRNFYGGLRQSFLALKLKFVKGRGYDTYESKEKKKEHRDESVVFTKTGTDDEDEEVGRVTYLNNIMHSLFSNVEVYNNNQQIYISSGLYAHKS